MRKIISGLFIAMDGVVEAPHLWQFDLFDADMMETMSAHIAEEDTMLLGRVTYEEWAPFWPTSSDEPYASHINNIAKYVVSTTLDNVAWGEYNNVTLSKGDLAGEIAKLQQQSGKNIGVGGSPTLVRSLLEQDLLDELILMIHPVIAGSGKRLFVDGSALKRMNLVASKITSSGVAVLTYRRYTQEAA